MPVSTENYDDEIADGKNVRTVKCSYCQSVILLPASGSFIKIQVLLCSIT